MSLAKAVKGNELGSCRWAKEKRKEVANRQEETSEVGKRPWEWTLGFPQASSQKWSWERAGNGRKSVG